MSQQIPMFPKKGLPRSLDADFSLFWLAYAPLLKRVSGCLVVTIDVGM